MSVAIHCSLVDTSTHNLDVDSSEHISVLVLVFLSLSAHLALERAVLLHSLIARHDGAISRAHSAPTVAWRLANQRRHFRINLGVGRLLVNLIEVDHAHLA